MPRDLLPETSQGSAYLAECFALLSAALLGASEYPAELIHFLSDCQSALAVISGASQYALGGIPEAACHAHSYLKQLKRGSDTFAYVPGHSGIAPNEVADWLSKQGARLCLRILWSPVAAGCAASVAGQRRCQLVVGRDCPLQPARRSNSPPY